MTRARLLISAAALLGIVALGTPHAIAAGDPLGLPAQIVDEDFPSEVNSYPLLDYGRPETSRDDRQGEAEWRVVYGTGNCCENFVTTTPEGRLLDFGGRYINFTDDNGVTWKSVRPLEPLINGEGAIALAPGGDVVGVEWDPYSGDHLLAFKYEADSEKWFYNETPVHTPFFDREWVTSVPGPFSVGGMQVPYITLLKGAWPSKEVFFYSLDGLNYLPASSKQADQLVNGKVEDALATTAEAHNDWIQPNTNTAITPLGNGGALAAPDWPFSGLGADWSLFGKDLRWRAFAFADGSKPEGLFQVDSDGRVHNVIVEEVGDNQDAFEYRLSSDGGETWNAITVTLPTDHTVQEIDFRANKAAGVAAVGMRARYHYEQDGKQYFRDRDLLYKLDITTDEPYVTRLYEVGLGDIVAEAGVGNSVRFDFETVTIFSDGRVAMSFLDSTTKSPHFLTGAPRTTPALAIEIGGVRRPGLEGRGGSGARERRCSQESRSGQTPAAQTERARGRAGRGEAESTRARNSGRARPHCSS